MSEKIAVHTPTKEEYDIASLFVWIVKPTVAT